MGFIRSIGRAIGGVFRGVGRVVSGVFKGIGHIAKGILKGVGAIAKTILGNPITGGIFGMLAGGLLGAAIGGPFGLMLGGMLGGQIGSAIGGFNMMNDMQKQQIAYQQQMLQFAMGGYGIIGLPGYGIGMPYGMGAAFGAGNFGFSMNLMFPGAFGLSSYMGFGMNFMM